MYAKMTYADVSRGLSRRPCKDDFAEATCQLPNWKTTAYGPREMAAHGVKAEHTTQIDIIEATIAALRG